MSWPLRKLKQTLKSRTLLTFGFILLVLCNVILYQRLIDTTKIRLLDKSGTNMAAFLVDTPACKIPKVDPYDSTIRDIVEKTEPLICNGTMPLTYEDGLQLRINQTVVNGPVYNGDIDYCRYSPIYRPKYEPTSKDEWEYLDESEPFNDSVTISDDFVLVSCFNTMDDLVYSNMHSFIQRNATVDMILDEQFKWHIDEDKVTEPPNVVMIGVDSVSRLSFLRQMTKTHKFLSETLGAVDMMGYNKVADNTFINIVPMTLGKFVAEMPWDETMSETPFDDFNFIWKQFTEKGYSTFYAEDAPSISIFDYLKAGFKIPPTDYFNRPVSLAMENEDLWTDDHHCFQGRPETQIVLDHLYNYVDTFRNDPYFAFTFITRLTHNDVNSAGAADELYYDFFKKLYDKGLLHKTVLFFFSDHGMRYGAIRETHIGKLEERLPFMFVAVPKWWKKNYGYVKNNLQINKNRLSTPFDVYETLQDILYFNGVQQHAENISRGVSWFREIPIERSCDQAGILPHWCTCLRYDTLNTTDRLARHASNSLVSEIVHKLNNYTDMCEELSLLRIKEATRLVGSDSVLEFESIENDVINKTLYFGEQTKSFEDVQVVIVTIPGFAMFEATVRIDTETETYTIVGDISRINKYGNHADCISVLKLKKFCHCKRRISRQ